MKNGIAELDMQGNLRIPKEIRNKLKMADGASYNIIEDENGLLLKKLNDRCIFCGSTENVVEKIGKNICTGCLTDIKSI